MAASLQDFTNTFVLSTTSGKNRVLSEVPKGLDFEPSRQRRVHRKSRAGCGNCKRRRVKCDGGVPCANCTQRGEQCHGSVRCSNRIAPSIPPTPTPPISPSTKPNHAVVNLLHMELFHHFQNHTRQTLLLAPEVWEYTIQLCFHFDFLMDTVLCIAARHLSSIRPEDSKLQITASNHLSRALCRFCDALNNDLTSTHVDAFIATSVLLQYEIWSNDDYSASDDNDKELFDPPQDNLFTFSSRLKQVFLKSISVPRGYTSLFLPHLLHNPIDKLGSVLLMSNETLAKCQDFFSRHRPLSVELLNVPLQYSPITDLYPDSWRNKVYYIHAAPDPTADQYTPVINRLCMILSFLPEARSPNSGEIHQDILPELIRYVCSFPVFCHGYFATMVQQKDSRALLLLYHFYRAVRVLFPPTRCWWAHKRAVGMENALREWLTRQCNK